MRRIVAALLLGVTIVAAPCRVAAGGRGAWEDRTVVHMRTEERVVALTFDDGPHPRYTPRILEVLARYGVKATFFMVGIQTERYPDTARMVAEAGHEIGNHTMHHVNLTGKDAGVIRDEAEACARRILDVTGVETTLFRAPEGARGEVLYRTLEGMGYRQVLWNIDTLDWQGRSSAAIAAAVTRAPHGGDIILCHDYIAGKLHIDRALDTILPAMQARGYRFVTVSELLEIGEVVPPQL